MSDFKFEFTYLVEYYLSELNYKIFAFRLTKRLHVYHLFPQTSE